MYLSFDDPKNFLQNFSHSVSKESAENLFFFLFLWPNIQKLVSNVEEEEEE